MSDKYKKCKTEIEPLVLQIKKSAEKCYLSRKYMCAEAVMVSLNSHLNGGLKNEQAFSMASPFSIAMGASGCICGALSGAVMACGLLLGGSKPYNKRRKLRECARQLHDSFKAANGSTCCRVLSARFKNDKKAHFKACGSLTADTAQMAARIILSFQPKLALKK